MIKLFLLLETGFKVRELDSHHVNSFKLIKSDNSALVLKISFKSIQDAVLYTLQIKDSILAVTELDSEMNDWIIDTY